MKDTPFQISIHKIMLKLFSFFNGNVGLHAFTGYLHGKENIRIYIIT